MNFLFCSLDSPGFLHPMIGIARVLRDRGHTVAFVTDLQHAGFLSGLRFERFPRGLRDGHSFQVGQWGEPFPIAIQVKHIEYALERFQADVLVGQSLTLGPLIVAERRQLPVALLGFCTYLWPPSDDPARRRRDPATEEWRTWRHSGMIETLDRARNLFRLPARESNCQDTPFLGDLFLVRSVPSLETDFADLPERVHLVGSCLWEPEEVDAECENWLADAATSGRPLVYVQHGRSFDVPSFWRELVEALGPWEYRVAASTWRLDSDIGVLPDNFFVRLHLPQGRILEQARVVVASANTTVVLGALSAGVPCLLIPAGGEQPDVAALCRSAGVAKTLRPDEATPEAIRVALEELLKDSRYQERAFRIASELARINGPAKAADLLETLAWTRRPVLRDRGPVAEIEILNTEQLDIEGLTSELFERVAGACDDSRCRDFFGCGEYCGVCEGVFSSDFGQLGKR